MSLEYIYHFHAVNHTKDGDVIDTDGVVTLDHKVISSTDYSDLRKHLAEISEVDESTMVVDSLTCLHIRGTL